MTKKEIALEYIDLLSEGKMEEVIQLFSINGEVISPIYGKKDASSFYYALEEDTNDSKLEIAGIYEEAVSGNLALYFNYQWTMKNDKTVNFDVVDIIEFDEQLKITSLKIIYDTVQSSKMIQELRDAEF